MQNDGTMEVHQVTKIDSTTAVCIVRCITGIVRVGDRVYSGSDTAGARYSIDLRIDSINLARRPVEFVDPPHAAEIQVSGDTVETLTKLADIRTSHNNQK